MTQNSRLIWLIGVVISLILVLNTLNYMSNSSNEIINVIRRLKETTQVRWGRIFGGIPSTDGKFPKMDCEFLGKSLCCSALNEKKLRIKHQNSHYSHCTVTKEYFPSPYEIRHLHIAEEIATLPELNDRITKYVQFIESPEEIAHAMKWIDRVAARQPGTILMENEIDREYLSRFKVTRKCPNMPNHSWWEYIEPLSVHARHPFGLSDCWHPLHLNERRIYNGVAPKAPILSVDYLLLQSKNDLSGHGHGNNSVLRSHSHHPANVFLFDAGTSRFDSSLYWFVCAYQQLGFVFDQIFGWEYTLLEPVDFWDHVPHRYIGLYHFFNAPISPDSTSRHSPTRLIKQLTSPEDFVSFKLDVDTPAVEIPIVLELLNNTELHPLIDEFFFELHFRCEVMRDCGWGYGMPENFEGLQLDRPSALKLFRDLRMKGIRAHFWP